MITVGLITSSIVAGTSPSVVLVKDSPAIAIALSGNLSPDYDGDFSVSNNASDAWFPGKCLTDPT